jgi:hypothetical protein
MLAQLDNTAAQPDVLDLLCESHANVRRFLDLGKRMALSPSTFEGEVRSIAGVIQRHSVVGLRLVISDEEVLVPYLAGRSPRLDRAIAQMRSNHVEYENHVRVLAAVCDAIECEPVHVSGRGRALGEAINAMAACLEPHLALVEREIFSALGTLTQKQRDLIRAALDALRTRAIRSDW